MRYLAVGDRPESRDPVAATDDTMAVTGQSRIRSLPAETVEFPVSYAAEKSMPLVRREPEDQPL